MSSYLLIGFYYTKPAAIAASKKAFIVTRFADLGFLIGILLLSFYTHTFNFEELMSGTAVVSASGATFMGCSVAAWALALIFIGGETGVGPSIASGNQICNGGTYACFCVDSCGDDCGGRGVFGSASFPVVCGGCSRCAGDDSRGGGVYFFLCRGGGLLPDGYKTGACFFDYFADRFYDGGVGGKRDGGSCRPGIYGRDVSFVYARYV